MLKLEALDRNTVRNIRLTDDTAYAEASIDWPALYSTEGPGQPAIEIRVEASVSLEEFSDPKRAVEVACQKAVFMLVAAFQARFPQKRLLTVAEVLEASPTAPSASLDADVDQEAAALRTKVASICEEVDSNEARIARALRGPHA